MTLPTILGAAFEPADPAVPELADALACRATRAACAEARIDPSTIELIVSLSVSPSHLALRPEIIGPRFGYIVHRTLGCTNAFVLDLIDADWIFAIEQATLFAHHQQYRRVLIVRAERLAGVSGETAGLLADGAAALLLGMADAAPAARYRYLPQGGLVTMRMGSGLPGDLVRLDRLHPVPPLTELMPEARALPGRATLVERWGADAPAAAGPFDLAAQIVARRAGGEAGPVTLVGLDILKGRAGAIEVQL